MTSIRKKKKKIMITDKNRVTFVVEIYQATPVKYRHANTTRHVLL